MRPGTEQTIREIEAGITILKPCTSHVLRVGEILPCFARQKYSHENNEDLKAETVHSEQN